MSNQQPRHPDEPRPSSNDTKDQTENYTDLESLHARPLGGHSYVVASERNSSETAYEVDIGALSCPCEDMEYNREDNEICAHLFKAILCAPDALEWNNMAAHDLATNMAKLESVVNRLERGNMTQAQPSGSASTTESTGGTADNSNSTASGGTADAAETMAEIEEWMDSQLAPAIQQAMDVREDDHGGEAGVAIEPDYSELSDSQRETMKQALKGIDGMQYHVGFDGECDSCGVEDGDFWYFVPVGWSG